MVTKVFIYFSDYSHNSAKNLVSVLTYCVTSFILYNKAHRISRKTLHLPRAEGGVNLPNLELYYHASQIFYIDHIINSTGQEPWVEMDDHQLWGGISSGVSAVVW